MVTRQIELVKNSKRKSPKEYFHINFYYYSTVTILEIVIVFNIDILIFFFLLF